MNRDECKREFREELAAAINRTCIDAATDTPDFLLADYLMKCLDAYDHMQRGMRVWKGGAK